MTGVCKDVRFGSRGPLEVYGLAGDPAEKRGVSADCPKVVRHKMLFTERGSQ